MKNKILILGGDGMAGHMIRIYLKEQQHEVWVTSRKRLDESCFFYDAIQPENIKEILKEIKPDYIVNCIGILNNQAEEKKTQAILINSYLPQYLAELSKEYGYKFIHISTDCVFSGEKGNYKETSFKDAESFYGKTKALGEINDEKNITLRTSIIGPDIRSNGIGLFKWFMSQNNKVNGYTNAIWTGVTTLQLAKSIEQLFEVNAHGLYHLVNNSSISKYELLLLVKKHFNKDIEINPYLGKRVDKSLINTRADWDMAIPTYEQMIIEMRKWIEHHKELYDSCC